MYYFGESITLLGEYAWYSDNSGGKTHPVGQLKPNAWGLYDMHGNVWEWVQDWFGEYTPGTVTDPPGQRDGELKVRRGGSWYSVPGFVSVSSRNERPPDYSNNRVGFRCAR